MRQYLDVKALITAKGKITPLAVIYDGVEYEIDRITAIGAGMHPHGLMYICLINGRVREIYMEPTMRGIAWYMWRDEPARR